MQFRQVRIGAIIAFFIDLIAGIPKDKKKLRPQVFYICIC